MLNPKSPFPSDKKPLFSEFTGQSKDKENKPLLSYDTNSAIGIAYNPYQMDYKRVLCVCSGGILRSATAAFVLSMEPFNFNTRSAGVEEYALIPVNEALLAWAHEIVCMTKEHEMKLMTLKNHFKKDSVVKCLNIPDSYAYRDKELIELIKERYLELV